MEKPQPLQKEDLIDLVFIKDYVIPLEKHKSAVEWLKKELTEKLPLSKGYYEGDPEDIILTAIDKAFPDLQDG